MYTHCEAFVGHIKSYWKDTQLVVKYLTLQYSMHYLWCTTVSKSSQKQNTEALKLKGTRYTKRDHKTVLNLIEMPFCMVAHTG